MRRVFSDTDRERVRAFFAEHLDDQTGFPIPTREEDRMIGIPSNITIAEDDAGAITGAVFASNDPEDVIRWQQQGEMWASELIASEVMMIHDLAVIASARLQGLGTQLVAAIVDNALAAGNAVVLAAFDDRRAGLTRFYERNRFTVLRGGETLRVEFAAAPGAEIGFPQSIPSYRWAVRVLGRATLIG